MKRISLLISILYFLSLPVPALPVENGFEKLREITSATRKAKTEVTLHLTGPVNYFLFKISNPERLVIELTSTLCEVTDKTIKADPRVSAVRAGQYKNDPIKITRVVLDMKSPYFYDHLMAGGNLIITVAEKDEDAKTEIPVQQIPAPGTEPAGPSAGKLKIERNIPTEDHKQLVEQIKKEEINSREERPVPAPEAKASPDKTSAGPAITETETGLSFSRKMISISFYEADIRNVLDFMSHQTGINFVYSPDVQGTVSLKLKNVEFDEAFKIILKMSGLIAQREADNIVRIITPAALKLERANAVSFTRVIPLKFARAQDVVTQLSSIQIDGINAKFNSDLPTNSIIVTTTPEGLENYEKLIQKFDVAPRQVMIEAKIIEVDYNEGLNLGINWSLSKQYTEGAAAKTSYD
ncbi:MAG TPA: secretin and TonB N-terminal domain-containing protein, partial [bacterium]|nr:secretin and TonB N-terminal domain-containing protein [bacterium]